MYVSKFLEIVKTFSSTGFSMSPPIGPHIPLPSFCLPPPLSLCPSHPSAGHSCLPTPSVSPPASPFLSGLPPLPCPLSRLCYRLRLFSLPPPLARLTDSLPPPLPNPSPPPTLPPSPCGPPTRAALAPQLS